MNTLVKFQWAQAAKLALFGIQAALLAAGAVYSTDNPAFAALVILAFVLGRMSK